MKFKKLLSFAAACAMAVTSLTGAISASAETNPSDFTVSGTSIVGYTGTDTDIVLPTEIDGVTMTTVGGNVFYGNTSITSVYVPEGYTALSGSTFRNCTALKSISLPNTLTAIIGNYVFRGCTALEYVNIPSSYSGSIGPRYFQDCSNPNLVIDIQSLTISSIENSNAFSNVTGTIKVYSQAMYDLIKPQATTANVVLVEQSNIEALETAIKGGEGVDTSLYSETTVTALTEAISAGKAVLANENATDDEISSSAAAINEAINALVFKGFTELDEVLAEAEDIVNNHASDYTTDTLQRLRNSITSANRTKSLYSDHEITKSIQELISAETTSLKNAISSLEEIDKTPLLSEISQLIERAEALDSSKYTQESFEKVTAALESAKTITEESTVSEINTALSALKDALSNISQITEPAGEPFAYVYKKGAVAKAASLTADESMTGATKIKITFDCASDVSYNPNASIEVDAMVAGTESYEKFIGTDGSYAPGTTDWTVELPLTSAVQNGDSIEITAFTYSWDNASDYVYAIKKIDFVDATGYIVKTITDKTVAKDNLAEAISKAEALDTANYTDESVAVLTAAIEAAKALTDEATVEEINAAATAIEDAVKGLTEKPAPTEPDPSKPDPTKPDPTNPEPSKPTTKTPAKTTAAAKATRSAAVVAKDKAAAVKLMKQAKIKKLTVKSKAKKKITVTWKKVKKAVGYEVQISNKKNFKKVILSKTTAKKKLVIKNKKLKSGKKYFVRVRAYATYKDANGTAVKVYSNWNKVLRKVKTK